MKRIITLSVILLASAVIHLNLSAAEIIPPVKQFDPYAVVKLYSGYRSSNPESGDTENEMIYRMQSNTRAGAILDIENIRAQVELGFTGSVYLRLAFITMDYGFCKFTLGQAYTPYSWFAAGDFADDNNMIGFGAAYDGRIPQFKFDSHGAYITIMTESKNTTGITGGGTSGAVADTSAIIPKTAIGYDYITGSSMAGFGCAVNAVRINDTVSTVDGDLLYSWLAYARVNAVIGDFTFRSNVTYGINTGNFGIMNITNPDTLGSSSSFLFQSYAVESGGNLEQTRVFSAYINPQYKISPALSAGAGAGYSSADNDTFSNDDSQAAFFVNLKYSINRYFSIMPEFCYRDFLKDKNGNDQGNEYYAGIQVQVSI